MDGKINHLATSPTTQFVNPPNRHDRKGVLSSTLSIVPIPHTTVVLRSRSVGMKRAHASAKGPPPLAPITLNRETFKWSASEVTSSGQSKMLRGANEESPHPGRSTEMRRAPMREQSWFQLRPQMREPGIPWKRKITGSEGEVEP